MAGQRSRVLVGAAVLVVALASCGSGSEAGSDTHDVVVHRSQPVTLEPGLVNLTPGFNLPTAESAVVAAIDHGLLAMGSHPNRKQGSTWAFRYDESTHELVKLTDPPFSPAAAGITGVWTDSSLIVLGVLCQDRSAPNREEMDLPIACYPGSLVATAYDPDTNDWSELPHPINSALARGNAGYAATGIGWTGNKAYFSITGELQAFDPAAKSWRKVADPPPGAGEASVCRTDHGLVASWTTPIDFGPDMVRPFFDRAISFALLKNGNATWTPITPPPITTRVDGVDQLRATCGATDLLVANTALTSLWLYDLADAQWREVPDPPVEKEHVYPGGASIPVILSCTSWTGREYLFDSDGHPESHAIGLDPRMLTWRKIQPAPQNPHPSPCSDPLLTSWRNGTVFGSIDTRAVPASAAVPGGSAPAYLWSWTPPDFDGVLPPFPKPQTEGSPPVRVPSQ